MAVGGVRQRDAGPGRAAGAAFDLVVSKLRRPLVRPGAVDRSLLVERLDRTGSRPIVSVVAPPGYGKTTLLSQWAERNSRPFAWVSVEDSDNDPKALLTYVAAALDAVEPIDERVFDALASPGSSVPGSVVPRLGSAFASMSSPVVLVLDDVHELHDSECRAAVSVLADHVPAGSRLALAGRAELPLRVPRLRAEGKLLEIGPGDLSLTAEEAVVLLRNAGVPLSEDEVAGLHQRTEGWPAALYLAALAMRAATRPSQACSAFTGRDVFVGDYLRAEILNRIPRHLPEFLTRSAVLERMSGPLCDAVLGRNGSAAELDDTARSNLLLVPLDRRGQWYRYHHLFRDLLLAELEGREPGLVPVLRRRAASWCLQNDLPEEALEYFIAAGDTDAAAGLAGLLMVPTYWQGRVATVQRWFRWLEDRGAIGRHLLVTVLAGILAVLTSRPAEAERWADVVDRWQYGDAARADDPLAEAWAAVLRAMLCRHGVERMRADADEAALRFAAAGMVAPVSAFLQGMARILCDDPDGADSALQDGVGTGQKGGAPEVLPLALSERSLLAMTRGEWDQAEAFASQARAALRRARMEYSYVAPLVHAAQARAAMHRGDTAAACQELAAAQRLRSSLTYALPYLAVQARIELARVHVALGDLAGARTLIGEIDELLTRRPDLGSLTRQAGELRARLAGKAGAQVRWASALTTAEMRLLPLLATHLSFPEIGRQLFLSPNTIKSQACSIYRKIGASTRSQAVVLSRELGLLDR
jgi:LuxR family transcriptional regulator, maltose regulon positive regulatory protein